MELEGLKAEEGVNEGGWIGVYRWELKEVRVGEGVNEAGWMD